MARAGLGWSIEKAAGAAGVGANTISRLENEQEISAESAERIAAAFDAAGVRFRDEPEHGLCVCIAKPTVRVYRRPTWVPAHDYVAVGVAFRDRKVIVFVGIDVLDDLDQWNKDERRKEEDVLGSFERNRALILQAAERALGKELITPDGRIYLKHDNFPKRVW